MRTSTERGQMDETDLLTVAAAVVDTVQAPPAMTLRQDRQSQIPTADRLTVSYSIIRH